jgi:hypothetical protein
MDEDTLNTRIEKLCQLRKEKGCPTTECPHLQDTLFSEVAGNSLELCMEITTLMAAHHIELNVETISDLIVLVSGRMIKYSIKTTNISFELCQACSLSTLIGDKNIQ